MAALTIICPHCQKDFSPDEAITHQIEAEIKQKYEVDSQKQIEEIRKEAREWKKGVEEEQNANQQKNEVRIRKQLTEQNELDQKLLREDAEENKVRNRKLMDQLTDVTRELRKTREEKDNVQLEMEKRLSEEKNKIQEEAEKKIKDEMGMSLAEKDKMLADALKANEELKQKLTQGSQQLQGEIQELEIERMLSEKFPFDEVVEVKKGINGADALQIVRDQNGRECGTLLWESKRTKKWELGWVAKLKEDKRNQKADIGIIVTNHLPKGVDLLGPFDGIFVADFSVFIALAQLMRIEVINLAYTKLSVEGKNDKKEILWNYLTGNEFKQRVEVIVESFSTLKSGIETEKRYFTKKWARDEKLLKNVVNQTMGMHGDLQGLMGKELPEIASLEIDDFNALETEITVEVLQDDALSVTSLFPIVDEPRH